MDKLQIKYRTVGKAIPPQPIRMNIGGWGGAANMKKNGSEPQPWHCPPFVEASTYGLELVYPYETECHVINDKGDIRFEWDFASEPGVKLSGQEFGAFFPLPAKFYLFGSSLDLQAPPGHVIRTLPHPRFFTDGTGTVPLAVMGHVQTEWWPRPMFLVFTVPPPGQRHIFRKGEAYAQILCVPHQMDYEAEPMTPDEEARRGKLDQAMAISGAHISKNVWHNPAGQEFKDYYKVMGRAFARDGQPGVEAVVTEALEHQGRLRTADRTIAECLDLGHRLQREGKFIDARTIYFYVLEREPENAEAMSRLGVLAAMMQLPKLAHNMMSKAVMLQPRSPGYRNNLGELLRRTARHAEAEAMFRSALELNPNDPQALSALGLTLAELGRPGEAVSACRAALAMNQRNALLHFRVGAVLARDGRAAEARTALENALALAPNFQDARDLLQEISGQPPLPAK
jgi:Flp pilus assembly protein TadD